MSSTALRILALLAPLVPSLAAAHPLAYALPDTVRDGSAVLASRPSPDQVIAIAVALAPRDAAGLARTAAQLTDPHDPAFRHWLTVAQVADRFGPTQADHDAVRRALAAGGLAVAAPLASRMVIDAQGRVADLEALLHIRFGQYRDPASGRMFRSPDRAPSLDADVTVLGITGLDDATPPVPHLVQAAAPDAASPPPTGSGPGGQFTGVDMRVAYYGHGPLTGAGQSVGLFEEGGYYPPDIQAYFTNIGAPFTVAIDSVRVNGSAAVCTSKCNDGEQALDIEQVIAMAPGLDRVVYYAGHLPISILSRMASDDTCASLSVSYGWKPDPALDESVLQEMAAQGQTLLVATGDYGYHLKQGFVWPSDDTWSIAVGGTDLLTQGAGGPWMAETGWRFSAGGPSPNKIPAPAWQDAVIKAANGTIPAGKRALPDISAEANTDNYICAGGRCGGGAGGTSFAAPRLAGFVALANQQAALAGLPSVGFFTPALYAAQSAQPDLHDVIKGFNGKWHARHGYDLVTGLGTPFGALTMQVLIAGK